MRVYPVILVITLVCGILTGCGSDSKSDSEAYTERPDPVGPTSTLDVPGSYPTIQAAINAAHSGDIVRVAAGRYTENLLVETRSISLRGAGIGLTILVGSVKFYDTAETSLEGFTIKGGSIHVKNSPVRLTSNEILDSPNAGIWVERSTNAIISDNIIRGNSKEGLRIDDSFGVIGNNHVTENMTDGMVINNASPTLTQNIITSNGADGISIRGFVSYAAPVLLENTVRKNGGISNYDIICFGSETAPTGSGNVFEKCINCSECRSFGHPSTYLD